MKNTILLCSILMLAAACQQASNQAVYNHGPAQGSTYNITYVASPGVDYREQIDSILLVIDKSLSLWDKQSTLTKLNNGDTVELDFHFKTVLRKSIEISNITNGAFDVTVAPLANFWGFGPGKKGEIDSARIDSIARYVGYKKLHNTEKYGALPAGMRLDFNAIAQGYTVDVIAHFLESKGIENYLVEVGGEMRTKGETVDGRVWTIGIDKPVEFLDQENRLQEVVYLANRGLATSGNYRKYWVDSVSGQKYVHTINPKTGFPIRSNLLSVTIVAPSAMEADGWATACMVVGESRAKALIKAQKNLDAFFIYTDLTGEWKTWKTEGFEKMIK